MKTSTKDKTARLRYPRQLGAVAATLACLIGALHGSAWAERLLVKEQEQAAQTRPYPAPEQGGNGEQQAANKQARIQMAILLDTSNSMDGLIDQARNQIWEVVNEFSRSRKNGLPPLLEVAVYEYGNSGLSGQEGYTRKVIDLSSDLDRVSEALFSLTTNGGEEYCGYAIDKAARGLEWSNSDEDIKVIFIAGNEPFTQGHLPYSQAIETAKGRGVVVNTIHAGSYQEGVQTGWKDGALLAGGNYMSIDHNHRVVHMEAPQDQRIAELNAKLNQTYVPYGREGSAGMSRQQQQDEKSSDISIGLLSKRAKSKASALYNNAEWDLVDAVDTGAVELESVPEEALPAPMQQMSGGERKQHIEEKLAEREAVKQEIAALAKERDEYITAKKSESAGPEVTTMNDALVAAIHEQGKKKAFEFKAE